VMVCSRHYPPDVDEFVESGLVEKPSMTISPPGILGCIAWMECQLVEEIQREKFSLIIGRVSHLEVDDRWRGEDGFLKYSECKPLGVMLGTEGMEFTFPSFSGRYASYKEMFTFPDKAKKGESV
jgi:flavin reductase (DIM6/NTAB) family NADH-FMN oxidoreductase RutF